MNATTGLPLPGSPIEFFKSNDTAYSQYPKWVSGFRPTDVKFDNCNRLLISSDGTVNSQNQRIGAGVVVVSNSQLEIVSSKPTMKPSTLPTKSPSITQSINAKVVNGFNQKWFNTKMQIPRAMYVTKGGNVLVVDTAPTASAVLAVKEDGTTYIIAQPPVTDPLLTHGLTVNNGKLYASTAGNVYQWSYTEGQITLSTEIATTVITNMPSSGYTTRPLMFDLTGETLYVEVGANTTKAGVDKTDVRSKIKSFNLNNRTYPIDWNAGQNYTAGIRNSPGLAFDHFGSLWVADIQVNSFPNNFRPDLGVASKLIKDNPAGRLIRVSSVGLDFG